MPVSTTAQARIDALAPLTRFGPTYCRSVAEALDYARRAARWGDCACQYIVEAEVCAGIRPRDDLGQARATTSPEHLTQGGVIHDALCSCPVGALSRPAAPTSTPQPGQPLQQQESTAATEPIPGAGEGAIDLTGLTRYTVGIVRLAEEKNLRPSWGQPHGRTRRINLNAVGPHGAFGSIVIGRTSGKVLRAEVIHGNDAKIARSAKGTNAVRVLLNEVRRSTCPSGCHAPSSVACRSA